MCVKLMVNSQFSDYSPMQATPVAPPDNLLHKKAPTRAILFWTEPFQISSTTKKIFGTQEPALFFSFDCLHEATLYKTIVVAFANELNGLGSKCNSSYV